MGPQVVKRAIGKATNEDIVTELRAAILNAWRHGNLLGIHCGKGTIKFSEFKDASDKIKFHLETVFDWTEGRKHNKYFPMIKDEEKIDPISGKVNGQFFMDEKFMMAMVS